MSEIKWNLAKKVEREKEEAKIKALKLAAKVFSNWKHELIKKPRTRPEIISMLYRLRDEALAKVDDDMEGWRTFFMDIIEDKVTQVMTDSIVARNDITEYVPTFGKPEPKPGDLILAGDIKKPRSFPFRSAQEFLQVPFIQSFSKKDGFTGFVRRDYFIEALFNDGDLVPVGKVSNTIGIVWIPTLEQFQKELAKSAVKKN